ncbi:unnamed protein product, partial [Ectocarpus sp. 13 AM-2016]
MPVEKNRFRRHRIPDVWSVWCRSDVLGFSRFPQRRRSRVRCPVPGVRCPDISIPNYYLAFCVPCVVVFLRSSCSNRLATPVFSKSFQHRKER